MFNLNLSLIFDSENKFLICGELVKFNLKISSPEFSNESEMENFMKRIGAAVESVEIDHVEVDHVEPVGIEPVGISSLSSSIESLSSSKKMKSVESLPNLLRSAGTRNPRHNLSKESQGSQSSMTSIIARRFNSIQKTQEEAFLNVVEKFISIPLEIFIDPERMPSSCTKATAKINVSLNEFAPIELSLNDNMFNNSINNSFQCSHKVEKIGQSEISLQVLRPLECTLRTHNISSSRALLQLNTEFKCDEEPQVSLEIEKVEIILSDSFTSRSNWNLFKISPISDSQAPFKFETSPQHYSLLFNWIFFGEVSGDLSGFFGENFHVRVDLEGKIWKREVSSKISLSFESAIPILNVFPPILAKGIKITSVKLLNPKPVIFEPFQIEFILYNFDETMLSIDLMIETKVPFCDPPTPNSSIQEWFTVEEANRCPSVLLMTPLRGIKVENIPSKGSKAIRLKLVPMRSGIINLNDEIIVKSVRELEILKIEPIIFRIE